MPMINIKVSTTLTDEMKDTIKSEVGELIKILGKPEKFTMVVIEDNECIYFGGTNEPAAYIDVKLLGQADRDACNDFTSEIMSVLHRLTGINTSRMYASFMDYSIWGWNGHLF